MKTETQDRLAQLERALDALAEGQKRIAQLADEGRVIMAEAGARADRLWSRPITLGGFDPGGAHDGGHVLGPYANTVNDAVEGELLRIGADRSDAAARRRALDAVLRQHPEWETHLDDRDVLAIVSGGATTPETDEGFRNVRDPGGGRWRRQDEAPILSGESTEGEAEMYGSVGIGLDAWANDRGEAVARHHMAVAAARRMGLRLSRPADRRAIFAEVFRRCNPTASIGQAQSLEEATWALSVQERLTMSQAGDQTADLTARAARLRPDLAPNYRAGRDTSRPSPRREPDADEAAADLDRQALKLLREQDCAPSDDAMTRARKHVLATRKDIGPRYGSRRD
jgi:hypothetical protein